jgi:LPXTG-site transpeptidase (sortase) family protein
MSRLLLALTTFLLGGLLVVVAIMGIRSQQFVASETVSRSSTLTQTPTSSAPTQAATTTATDTAQSAPVVTPVPADELSRSPTPAITVQPGLVVKPAFPAGAATDAQARIIPILPLRSQPYANRTLPPVRLVVPSIGVDSRVIQLGTKYDKNGTLVWETPPFAVGHYRGTANPGAPGNVVLGGHISSPNEGSVFKRLPEVEIGDGVIVETAEKAFLYQVTDIKVVDPDRVEVMDPTESSIVTLITCVPDGIYTQRLIVRAEAV